MRELDLILGRFADQAIGAMTEAELDELERLMDVPDRELLGWVTYEVEVPSAYDTALLRRLCEFHHAGSGLV
jgi:antitoxin CptB